MPTKHYINPLAAALIASLVYSNPALSASHREAPLIALDPTADITDVYAFRNWNDPDKVVFIMNVIPAQEPSSGPNYFNFDDNVLYQIHLDTNQNGIAEDIVYEFRFNTEIRDPFKDLPIAYASVDNGPSQPPGIIALDGDGSKGLGLRQRYSVIEKRGRDRRDLATGTMFTVPSNIGPRTIPDYEGLTKQGVYSLNNGGRVFTGQRDETFYIDLGATFDTLNFRAPPILDPTQDAVDTMNPFGNDMFSGFNINTIAIEVPISDISDDPNAVIGMYASTSRRKIKTLLNNGTSRGIGPYVQVARMANPLVNELIIGTGQKDRWNASNPRNENRFIDFYLNSQLANLINLAFGTNFPTTGRTDLVAALLKYPGQDPNSCSRNNRCSDLLRLNLGVDPTQPESQHRLGGLAGDAAGFPNGRRPNDDVTDITLRVVAGALLGPVPALGDGVNFNIGALSSNITDNGIYTVFPFLPTPHDGRDRQHIDCDEAGANPCVSASIPNPDPDPDPGATSRLGECGPYTDPSSNVIDGKIVCFGYLEDVNGDVDFGIELANPPDSASGNLNATPSTILNIMGGLEFQAAASNNATVDKFYIVSEEVANTSPSFRVNLSDQIFGPFNFGSLDNALSYALSPTQVSQMLAWQSASSFGGVVFLFIPPDSDIFTSNFERFAGVVITASP